MQTPQQSECKDNEKQNKTLFTDFLNKKKIRPKGYELDD
jgi:hypothetical protein